MREFLHACTRVLPANVRLDSMPLNIVLFEPEIPPNTGNIIRLCANTGARLHLVKPLGFRLDARAVRRSGLDYAELAEVRVHESLDACLAALGRGLATDRPGWYALTTKGEISHDRIAFAFGDVVVFGPETRGLPDAVLEACPPQRRVRIPMQPGARSLNLSNAAAVVAYEAWRQLGWATPPRR
jgi:tRNA (cytidine/uridine-2'-O-)-methyltransferase